MSSTRFLQLDVFTPRPGGGNPLGVVLGAHHWSDAGMQAFARWTNLVETTFLLPPRIAGASYRLRIFTPEREIPFAGHPSVGSAHAALETGFVDAAEDLQQECGAGVLPLRVRGTGHERRIFVRAPAARLLQRGADADLARLLHGLRSGALGAALVEGGRRWWLAELTDEAELRAWRPDHAAIAALARASDSLGLCVFARSRDPEFELVVRAFPAGVGIVEDPASGAANGLVAAYLALDEPGGSLARGYRVSQGRELGRDARLEVLIESDGVWVGGQTCTVIDGRLDWDS